jgi:uncharacterized protein YggE
MKLAFTPILAFFVLLFAYTKLAGPIPFSLNSVVTTKTDTFSVSGEGKVSVTPDIALVTAGVSAQGTTVKAVQQELNTKMNAVTAAIKTVGIEGKDIQTSNYNIGPTYDYSAGKQKLTGYEASSNLTIKVRVIDRANAVVDAATANGANEVGGISFGIDDKTKAEDEARKLAVAEAKKKAETAAKTAGFALGRIINYQESQGPELRPMAMYDKGAIPVAGGGGAPTEISTGTDEVVVTVSLTYQLN